jgi:hypothetical protein
MPEVDPDTFDVGKLDIEDQVVIGCKGADIISDDEGTDNGDGFLQRQQTLPHGFLLPIGGSVIPEVKGYMTDPASVDERRALVPPVDPGRSLGSADGGIIFTHFMVDRVQIVLLETLSIVEVEI